MFGFFNPQVSGLKNILIYYSAYQYELGLACDIPPEKMEDFATWYYAHRLGPPLVSAARSYNMQSLALFTAFKFRINMREKNLTIIHILYGLLAAEGITGKPLDHEVLMRTFDKHPEISPEIRGI